MKKLTQSPLLAAAVMLLAGSAYAQAPTNTYQGNALVPFTAPIGAYPYSLNNPPVSGASAGTYSKNYSDYSQDSYVSQTGGGNHATVDQADNRTYSSGNGAGSTAVLVQKGDNNNATQHQTLTDLSAAQTGDGMARNLMSSKQNGSASQTDQTQNGGSYNVLKVIQGEGTTGNRAIQSQTVYTNSFGSYNSFNQAAIAQTGSGNRAEQSQGGLYETAKIDQAGFNSYAKQTQQGFYSDANIVQGASGANNTAIQSQVQGDHNNNASSARIRQAVSGAPANNNYAVQTQLRFGNQADITQNSSNNFAHQDQLGNPNSIGFPIPNNISVITQSNVASAAYTTQTGNENVVTIKQH